MMLIYKQKLKITFLFFILGLVVFLPLVLSNFYREQLFGKPTIDTISPESFIDLESQSENYDIVKRILMILNSETVVVDRDMKNFSASEAAKLVEAVENEITVMQNLNALPKLSFSESKYMTFKKISYIPSTEPNEFINVWDIYIEYKDFQVDISMDIETGIIYNIVMLTRDRDAKFNKEVSPKAFFDYLKLDSQSIKIKDIELEGRSYYILDDIYYQYIVYENAIMYKLIDKNTVDYDYSYEIYDSDNEQVTTMPYYEESKITMKKQ